MARGEVQAEVRPGRVKLRLRTETRDGCHEVRGRRGKRRPERQQEAGNNGKHGHAQRFRGRTAVTEVAVVQLSVLLCVECATARGC
eukprot:SAG25_NODE_681_length_5951_cov_1.849795_4_plen_86_part_00